MVGGRAGGRGESAHQTCPVCVACCRCCVNYPLIVYVYIRADMNVFACFHGGQRLIHVGVFLNHSLLKGLRLGFSLTLGLPSPARLPCGEDQGFSSCLPFPQHWDYRHLPRLSHLPATLPAVTSDSYSLCPLTSL